MHRNKWKLKENNPKPMGLIKAVLTGRFITKQAYVQQQERNQKGNKNMHRNKWKWKHNNQRHMGISKKNAKGKVHSFTSLPQETREK